MRSNREKYVIVVEREFGLPSYVQVTETGIRHTAVLDRPTPRYTYRAWELPDAITRLRKEYPEAFVAAYEVANIEPEAMRRWWKAKSGVLAKAAA
jgi:hypothetical protein